MCKADNFNTGVYNKLNNVIILILSINFFLLYLINIRFINKYYNKNAW